MTDEFKPCPNNCSSAGEIWDGEGLQVCPVCHGNTVVNANDEDAMTELQRLGQEYDAAPEGDE